MPQDTNPTRHCAAVTRLFGGARPTSFVQRAKNLVGSSLGQAAFNYITDKVPRIRVKNNVNGAIRRFADEVNSGNVSYAGKAVNAVSRVVFGVAGINPNVVPPDPNGKTIYDRGKRAGEFLAELAIAGAISELHLPGPIGELASLAFLQSHQNEDATEILDPSCGITPYARDLIHYAPKFSFMFLVQITFQPDYNDLNFQENSQTDYGQDIKFQYLCKEFRRPNVRIEYEDLNMYNYSTSVPKRTIYEPISLKLYDDNQNASMIFLEKYLKSQSPIIRMGKEQQDTAEHRGMDFSPYEIQRGQSGTAMSGFTKAAASIEGLVNENRSIIRRVDVYHIFNYGMRANLYSFMNPKISQYELSLLNMEDGQEPAVIDIQMKYDSMHIETDIDMMDVDTIGLSQLSTRNIHSKGKP